MKGVSTFEHEECHRLWFLLAKLKNVANRSYKKNSRKRIDHTKNCTLENFPTPPPLDEGCGCHLELRQVGWAEEYF
jgi:hypothetical protein